MNPEELFRPLEARGYRGRIVPIGRVHDLRDEIERQRQQGFFDAEFYQECLAWFQFGPPESLPDAQSVVVVAVPQPQVRVAFTWQGQPRSFLVPPTYLHWSQTDQQVGDLLAASLGPQGCQVVGAGLPAKLLAVHSGLGAYGRNNICYVDGLGSFHRLAAFYTDRRSEDDPWREPQLLARCQDCQACRRVCPTGAIPADRFLLHAERCLTFRNEKPGEVPFPTWVDSTWHNCLVGCMRCQQVCPENRDVRHWVDDGAEFTEEETSLLVTGVPLAQLPADTVQKLERCDLVELLDILPRNLGVLLGQPRVQGGGPGGHDG